MKFENEALGEMIRDVASGWPTDQFLRELRARRRTKRRVWTFGLAAVAGVAAAVGITWSIASSAAQAVHPHGHVGVAAHDCDAGDDISASFRAAAEAEALGDTQCAARNFSRVVELAQPEHGRCSVADHPVDAQVAIARWELARLGASK